MSDEEEDNKIEVKKSFLEELQNQIQSLKRKTEILEQAADKKSLALAYERQPESLPTIIRLRTMNDKVVIGWRTTKDIVEQNPATGKWIELQKVEVLYEDGGAKEMYLVDFNRHFKHVKCKRLAVVTDENGNTAYKLKRLDNGKEYTIGSQFVN
ncbi:MAG: hypothetical protein GWP09_02060 [Nitrospiraceae bacterium]|nr:hypothetical protein [Nitrospiraceae bacterium]